MGKKATKELVLNKITRKTAKSVCDFILAGWHIICYNNFEHNRYKSVFDFITKAGETVDARAQVKEILDENGGIAKSADFVSAGIRATELVNLCNLGYLTRVRHGYYEMAKESGVSEERMLAVLVPQGIVCVESALFHFGYSDFAPRKWSIAIPRSMSRRKLKIDTLTGVNKHSVVLDPCCGSGSFLVRAMTQALDDCATAAEQENVKKHQIYGIEYDENIYGLATTNMLIHSDGNSNIRQGSCFAMADWIKEAKPNVILMNPPYNGQRIHLPKTYVDTWAKEKKEDPSKGLYFVKYMADTLNSINQQAKLAVLLPVACAIGTSGEIARLKREILKENTLDAVFTLPNEIFYPGASASACCMVFKIGIKHTDVSNPDTFFGYCKDDGFKKKKNIGRVEQTDSTTGKSKWTEIENQWIELYRNRKPKDGLSATHKVTGDDEWLCEAYMKTDYTKLTERDFQQTINEYLSYLVKEGNVYEA